MTQKLYLSLVAAFGAAFAIAFAVIVIPPLLASGDVAGAFAAGFVNPYATGYSLDAIFCGLILISWVLCERGAMNIRHGWIVIPLCVLPGVATAFAVYLIVRSRQLDKSRQSS